MRCIRVDKQKYEKLTKETTVSPNLASFINIFSAHCKKMISSIEVSSSRNYICDT